MRLFRVALIAAVIVGAGPTAAESLRIHPVDHGGLTNTYVLACEAPARQEWADAAPFRDLLDQIRQPDGGFTLHAVTGIQPISGFALSIHKDRELTKPVEDLKLVDLVRFARANEDLLRQPDYYFGVWHDPKSNMVYLDVSVVVNSASEAERLGRQNQQGAYFDLEEGQSVDIVEEAA